MTALSENDRARVRHHLGYLNVEPSGAIALGFPAAQQPQFLVERAMDRVIPAAISRILCTLDTLDKIEGAMAASICRLSAQQLGELKIRNSNEEPTEGDLLEREYRRWAMRLADDLGAPLNPFSERFRAGSASTNLPVAAP